MNIYENIKTYIYIYVPQHLLKYKNSYETAYQI